ncbi:MAG: hypothetical protein WA211_08605 [Candidatus Acidiferrales bacterium]|jgi:hypothetical protein
MFRQLVTPPPADTNPVDLTNNINSLFVYHPLQISALIETVWLNRANIAGSQTNYPFVPWSPAIAWRILNAPFFSGYDWSSHSPKLVPPSPDFVPPLSQPGIQNTWDGITTPLPAGLQQTNWDHMIYAYVIENTRIFEIFSKVLETYMFSEQLETPSPASQQFWRNVEFLIYGDAMPSMLWTTSSRLRRDEIADRLTTYFWLFGIDLSHAAEIAAQHPYQKPAAANRDFIPTFEAFGREVWRGIINAKNSSGANDTDPTVIASLAQRLYDMMATRRINGNLCREEFRAVAVMSFLHLAVLFDSPAVVDLKATASSPEMRLQKIAERVGMTAHPKSKPFFDLAAPFSILMQSVETGQLNDTTGAATLYSLATPPAQNAETVIDQYSLATGRDLKSQVVSVAQHTSAPHLALPKYPAPPPQLAARHGNGHAHTQTHGMLKQ